MLLTNIIGIIIILLNLAGIIYLLFLGFKKITSQLNQDRSIIKIPSNQMEKTNIKKDNIIDRTIIKEKDDMLDDLDLSDFDDLNLDDFD